jgi:hypothetical protein
MIDRVKQKSVILVGRMPNQSMIIERLAAVGIPAVQQTVNEALEMLCPEPWTPSSTPPVTNLYLIGEGIPEIERDRLIEWLSEEGGGPYLYLRGANSPRTLPFHFIEPHQTPEQVVQLIHRYLENI